MHGPSNRKLSVSLATMLMVLVPLACNDAPSESPNLFGPDLAKKGKPGGGGGGCSDVSVNLTFHASSPGYQGDGLGEYRNGTDGVAAEIQCDGNFDLSLTSGLKRRDPQVRFVDTHVVPDDPSLEAIGPSLEDARFKSGNAFDVYGIPAGDSEDVGLSVTWETEAGIRYQVRYGGATDCASGDPEWSDTPNYVTVDHPSEDAWTISGSRGLLCRLDTNDRNATPQPMGMAYAPFTMDLTRQ